jgi:uncharacterized protein YjcR
MVASKAARIRELHAKGMPVREIAAKIGCSKEYVRVAARQRVLDGGRSAADQRYAGTHADQIGTWKREYMQLYQRERYANDPEFRRRRLEASAKCKKRRRERERQAT